MSYFLAPSLVQLRNEINRRWPNRNKASDGWIGDPRHQASVSDHNPDWRVGGKRRGVVRAIDVTVRGIDVDLLLKHTTNDARVAYVIYNRRIFEHAHGWRRYTGSNPHTTHVHISVGKTAARENQTHSWFGSATTPKTSTAAKPKSTKKKGDPNNYTVRTEAWLRRQLPIITKGTSKNTTPHLIGLYQRQQIKPYTLKHDQIWGRGTDQHYRWVHALQVELNKWKGKKLKITKTFDRATRNRVIEWQKRNMGGVYKGTRADGVVGPLTIKPLGIKKYPN